MAGKSGDYKVRVAIVDRYSGTKWYSWRLYDEINRILPKGSTIYYYGSKNRRDISSINSNFRAVWTSRLYPFQIVSQALKDKINIIHIQFEFVTFGSPYSSLLMIPLLILLKLAGVKIVITIHGPIFPRDANIRILELLSPSSNFPPFLLKMYCRLTYKMMDIMTDALIVHADIFKKWLAEIRVRKVFMIPHGIDIENIIYVNNDKDNGSILCFGVVSPRKGLESLIKAFATINIELNEFTLVIAGGEPSYYKGYLDILKKYALDKGIGDRVVFTGYIKDDDVAGLFQKAIVVVAPYPFSISASGVLAQAMGFGKPIIATATDYSSEILEDGKEALLVPAGDFVAMGNVIQNLVHNQALRQNLAANVKVKAQKYRWPLVAKNTISLYKNILYKNSYKS